MVPPFISDAVAPRSVGRPFLEKWEAEGLPLRLRGASLRPKGLHALWTVPMTWTSGHDRFTVVRTRALASEGRIAQR